MKTLKDGAALLILLTLLVSVRITPVEEPQRGIVPEAQASAEQSAPLPAGQIEPLDPGPCRHEARTLVIQVDEVESEEQAEKPSSTC